jgi:amino acid adenylation domain-containing protein
VRISSRLDAGVLQQALDSLVTRHEALRTRIVLVDANPMQEVADEARAELTVDDVSALPEGSRDDEGMRRIAEVAWRPFDLERDVLLRAALVHVGPDEDLLLLVNHHLVSDHASGPLLFHELSQLYDAIAAGRQPEIAELPIQYPDFAAWQRSRLSGDLLDELLSYWREALDGAPERLELPADRPRAAAQSYRGETVDVELPAALVTRLRDLACSSNVSLFVVLLSAFKVLLQRYSGQSDLVVGTPVSGRHYEETAALVGYFSNTLPLHTDLGGDPSFRELLGRVRGVTLGALAYQELPFERLVQELNPDRAASHTPIFQVLFGFDIDSREDHTFAGKPVEHVPIPANRWSRFDISLVIRQRADDSIDGFLEYASELFEPTTAARMLRHFKTLLEAVAENPDHRLSELPLLTTEERRRTLADWNATEAGYPTGCLHELVAQQAAKRPNALAVEFRDESLTYAQLDQRANQLAHELIARGAGPGSLVGICVNRSLELVVALLGVLKSGAAYVPIDPSHPANRQAFLLEDAQVPVLLTQASLVAGLPEHDAEVVCLDRDWPLIGRRSANPVDVETDPDQLAYVIYTSGSTGKPKGVEIAHRSVVNLVTHMSERPGLDEHDTVANLTTPAFDLSVPDWYLPLCHGARLVIVPPEHTLDGALLAADLERCGATFVQATPTTWQLLVDAGWQGNERLKVVCGGEALPPALAKELREKGELWHMYGPTETTVWSSVLRLERCDGPPPLGGPIANTSFYVLDENEQPVPIGIPGELYIGGVGLARGYHHRPELTAEKFVRDPFSTDPAARLYRTGDLVRWRDAGTLEFLGRIDQQVKLRGFRIELGEVESVLGEHPAVGASVAIVREDSPGDQRLVAYVVPENGDAPSSEDLRQLARAQLPPYMVPSAFVTLDALPVNANRKLDRSALPVPDGARPVERPYTAARTPVEEALVDIWREVLGVDQAGIDDDFFDLGGHSLLAVKMLSRVLEAVDVEVPLPSVFDGPTIRELGELVSRELLGEASDEELEDWLAEIGAEPR